MKTLIWIFILLPSLCYGQKTSEEKAMLNILDSLEEEAAALQGKLITLDSLLITMDSICISEQIVLPYKNIDNPIKDIKQGKKTFDINYSHYQSILPGNLPVEISELADIVGFGFKFHPVYKIFRFHSGIDFPCSKGEIVKSTIEGDVTSIKKLKNGYGNHIIIEQGKISTIYAHLDSICVRIGEEVKEGQIIGTVGDSGAMTQYGLHYEILVSDTPVNPLFVYFDKFSDFEILQIELYHRESFD